MSAIRPVPVTLNGRTVDLEALEAQIADLEAKWGMTFEAFSAKCAEGTLAHDAYAYEVERDFWDWEQAVTLKQHYESIKVPW